MIKRVCVYCASSSQIDKVYFEATDRLGRLFVDESIEVVFGGGGNGLMGQLADSVLEAGGHITGIMPHFMKEVEWAHKKVENFHFVADMHERKKKFLDGTDAVVALPGGCGTLEELFEVITLKRLGLFLNPIVILNTNDYYQPLKAMLDRCIEQNFMKADHGRMWTIVDSPEEVIPAIRNMEAWDQSAINFAVPK